MIDSREGLVDALTEASELEHGLMLQYLFAALSLKKRLDEGLTPAQQEQVRSWEGAILGIARDEMGHLGTVPTSIPSSFHSQKPERLELMRVQVKSLKQQEYGTSTRLGSSD